MKSTALLSLAALLITSGCHATLKVRTLAPAPVSLGAVTQLSIVETTGRRSAREELIAHVINGARSAGHFQVKDRSEEGLKLELAGRKAKFIGGAPGPQEAWVRFDVHQWETWREAVSVKDAKGNQQTSQVPHARVNVGVTIVTPSGTAVLAEREYAWSWFENTETGALNFVARRVVGDLLNDVTPRPQNVNLRLDDEDKGQAGLIKVAQAGNLAQAITDARAYAAQNPLSGSALYNLAVFLDASGAWDEALSTYAEAISKSSKPWYADARAGCAQRQAVWAELQQAR